MSDKLLIISIENRIGEKLYFRSNKIIPNMEKDLSKFWKRSITRGTMFSNQNYLTSVINSQLKYAYTKENTPDIGILNLETLTVEIFDLTSTQKVFMTETEVINDFVANQLPIVMKELNALKIELEK